jgi:hypothetical protein
VNQLIKKITNWEQWPFKLLYAPIGIFWLIYIIRARAVWFFTPSNPKLTFGGMEGEPKREMYDLLPKELYPATCNVLPGESIDSIRQKQQQHGIGYPFVVKPEVGGQGVLFRKIDTEAELLHYHGKVPVEYIMQNLVYYPMEVSVFYIRHPQAAKGTVTGFLHKVPLQVKGDGVQTLEQLVQAHPKGKGRMGELYSKHKENWHTVLPMGQNYMLSYAANHNRGAHFIDLKAQIDDALVAIFDRISHDINDFFYGRYDIMCTNVEDLKAGKNFTILEYNGCGAEPNHFYDTGYTLLGAYREILRHWKALYTISMYNRKTMGIKPWPLMKGRRFLKWARKHLHDMKAVDATI